MVNGEGEMKADLLQMLANFTRYMKDNFQDCVEGNSAGELCGCFRGENTMGNDERGVRPNADLGMICAFLVVNGEGVRLPAGVTWADLEEMAMKSLVFAYSTHKANRLKACAGGNYWGSTSVSDHVWESSLWAMSVAYSAYFLWDRLSDRQRGYIYAMLKSECNYELEREIPTGYAGDTKAEENGWEADVLAATLGLFPDDPLAPKWFARLREFAINSYSQKDDANDRTVIDPDYDTTTVADLYRGQNLYDDYTLQNHNYFHTSYQNVVIQELGEAALALKLFQTGLHGKEKWKTNALMHNNQKVMDEVLYWLALSDGELAMPNGNDWSLFLYDQITSYSTIACFLRDLHALLLENLAYKMIKARQKTTGDGSWLLRADVGARRMGVEAHRVMMTWLMHDVLSTADMSATPWEDFRRAYGAAKVFTSQNIIRASTDSRFTCFSWSKGLKSYTGYIAPHANDASRLNDKGQMINDKNPHNTNLIVPFRANNTGNFIGWYEVEGKKTNAESPPSPRGGGEGLMVNGEGWMMNGEGWMMNGELQTNDGTLNNRFAIYSTPGNAVIYIDNVRAEADCTITAERGGLMAISVDELTKTSRTFYTEGGAADKDTDPTPGPIPANAPTRSLSPWKGGEGLPPEARQLDGTTMTIMTGSWVNIDNAFGIVKPGQWRRENMKSLEVIEVNEVLALQATRGRASDNSSAADNAVDVASNGNVDRSALPLGSSKNFERSDNFDNSDNFIKTGSSQIAFGDRANNNSIMTAKLYASYSDRSRTVKSGDMVDSRAIVYYSNVSADTTAALSLLTSRLATPDGWNGVVAFDPDGTAYLALSNFRSEQKCPVGGFITPRGIPVLSTPSDGSVDIGPNQSHVDVIRFFVDDPKLRTVQEQGNPNAVYLQNTSRRARKFTVHAVTSQGLVSKTFKTSGTVRAAIHDNTLTIEELRIKN